MIELCTPEGDWLPDETLGQALSLHYGLHLQPCLQEVVQNLKERSGKSSFDDDATLVGLERHAVREVA